MEVGLPLLDRVASGQLQGLRWIDSEQEVDIHNRRAVAAKQPVVAHHPQVARLRNRLIRRLGAEKPDVEKEIARVETEAAKVRTSVERYFEAFEAGTLKAELCNQKVQELHDRLEQLGAEKRRLESRRERLELPAIDREMLSGLVDNFEQVIGEGPNAQKKDLLRRLVKKVLVHDRRTIEIWYGLPNSRRFEDRNKDLPEWEVAQIAQPPIALLSPELRFRAA